MSGLAYGRDYEIVQRLRPEPMTVEEAAGQQKIEDVDFEIFRHKMNMIAQEGKETTMKLGASTGMRWGDVAFAIYTAQGDLAVVATGIWFHAVLGQIPVKYILKHYVAEPSVGLKEGDSFFWNDPFYGGVHAADMGLAVPVFDQGKLVCFVGAVVHTGENGATDPGGMSNTARSRYDDGLLCPPIKVGERYTLREDILTMIGSHVRDPRTMILDIKARLAASRIAERRIQEVLGDKGPEFFIGGLRRILSVTAEAAKKKVALLSDGIYRQPRFLDTVGTESALVKINLTITKKGDGFKFDFEGSSPMFPDKPLNSYFHGILGLAMVYFCGWFFHDLPANNGLLETIEWHFPEDSFINAKGEVSTGLAPYTQTAFTLGMFLCGARMSYGLDPLRAVAAWYTGFGAPMFGGINQWGEPMADTFAELNATGCGARPDMDGVDCAGSYFATMSDCGDVESTEEDRPFLYLFRNYFRGSYGHGKYRGGAGLGYCLIPSHVPGVVLGAFGYGSKFPATVGIFGGYAVPPTFVQTVRGSNMKELLAQGSPSVPVNVEQALQGDGAETGRRESHHSSMRIQPFQNGDTVYLPVGGGAGYGDALERDPEAVIADLRDGMVTPWAARNIYRVVYDDETLRLDREKTRALREEARVRRKQRGKPYGEFEKEWLKLRPREEVIKYYGTYPVSRAT